MKKVFLAAVVALASLTANAQIWVGGSLGVDFTTPDFDDAETTTTFTVSPEVGYTLSDKWDIAVAINSTFASCDGESATNFSIEPYARYTFAKADKVSFFVDGGFGFGSAEITSEGVLEDSRDEFYIGVRPGLKVALTDKFAVVAKTGWLGYQQVKDVADSFGFNVNGNALQFGLYYAF